jgi:hypothetical protein
MNVKVLKAIVAFLGVLIVFGVVGLFVGLIYKIDADKGFPPTALELPPGAKLLEMTGVGDRLILRAALPDGGERLLVVDPKRGRTVGVMDAPRP